MKVDEDLAKFKELVIKERSILPKSLLTIIKLFSVEELATQTVIEQKMLAALTGQRFGKSVSKYKIQNSKCFQVILQFLEPPKILTFQTLSRRLYNEHVPAALFTMRLTTSSFLNSIQMFVMRSLFSEEAKLNLLYTGSRHDFSAHVFHQICDN